MAFCALIEIFGISDLMHSSGEGKKNPAIKHTEKMQRFNNAVTEAFMNSIARIKGKGKNADRTDVFLNTDRCFVKSDDVHQLVGFVDDVRCSLWENYRLFARAVVSKGVILTECEVKDKGEKGKMSIWNVGLDGVKLIQQVQLHRAVATIIVKETRHEAFAEGTVPATTVASETSLRERRPVAWIEPDIATFENVSFPEGHPDDPLIFDDVPLPRNLLVPERFKELVDFAIESFVKARDLAYFSTPALINWIKHAAIADVLRVHGDLIRLRRNTGVYFPIDVIFVCFVSRVFDDFDDQEGMGDDLLHTQNKLAELAWVNTIVSTTRRLRRLPRKFLSENARQNYFEKASAAAKKNEMKKR